MSDAVDGDGFDAAGVEAGEVGVPEEGKDVGVEDAKME